MDTQGKFYQAMHQAVSQTLENMVFVEVMAHPDKAYIMPEDETVWTSLLINDPVQGELILAMPHNTLEKFTGNIFAMPEDDLTDTQKNDILNELLNTIAGLFMTNLLAQDQQYKLGLPAIGHGKFAPADADTLVWKLITSDDDPLEIRAAGAPLIALQNQ